MAPALTDEFYAESYRLRKAASSMTAAVEQWFKDHSRMLVETVTSKSHWQECSPQKLKVLSVGSGEGDLDLEIIHSLLPWIEHYQLRLTYVAVEPNVNHRTCLINTLEAISKHPAIDIQVKEDDFLDLNFDSKDQSFNLILMIHVLYYFQDPYQAINKAYQQLSTHGKLVIVHQEETGIPQIQRQYMKHLKGNEEALLTAEIIRDILQEREHSFEYYSLYACLEITECLAHSEVGISIMSFCLECDLREVNSEHLGSLSSAFQSLAKSKGNGSAWIDEPIGLLILPKSESRLLTPQPRIFTDQDPTVDYWQLANQYYWSTFLSPVEANPQQMLDIACGTGRWIQAFQLYVELAVQQVQVTYDLLDPNPDAIAIAAQRLKPPFQVGQQYPFSLQAAPLPNRYYDLLWSMHGFYMMDQADLNSIVTKCEQLLKPTGMGWIALATHQSFYVDFYDKYLQCFFQGQGQRFTAAEDVVDALNDCGIKYQINRIIYEEPVPMSNQAAVEHYIKTESVVNSFAQKTESNQLTAARDISLEEMMSDTTIRSYLDNLVREGIYYFPQEVWLISFYPSHTEEKNYD